MALLKIINKKLVGRILADHQAGILPIDISVEIPRRDNDTLVRLFDEKETAALEHQLDPTQKPGWLFYSPNNPFWSGANAFQAKISRNGQVYDTSNAEDKIALAILKASKIATEETAENADLVDWHIVNAANPELTNTTALLNYDKVILYLNGLSTALIAGTLVAIANIRAELLPEGMNKGAILEFFKKTIFEHGQFNTNMLTKLIRFTEVPTAYLETTVILEAGVYAGAIRYAGTGVEKPYEINGKFHDYKNAIKALSDGIVAKATFVETINENIKNFI